MKTTKPTLTLDDVATARRRLAGGLRLTPCLIAPALSAATGRELWLKREDLQRTGSFKERGARHALLCLTPQERARGVVAASAGNHALGLAYHGGMLGVKVIVVMPLAAAAVKVARCRSLGAEVVLHGENFDAAQVHARELAARTGATVVSPFDDLQVVAGQGTMALEILEQVPAFDTLVVPVGGGGLLAGSVTVLKALRPSVHIVAVEAEHAAKFSTARRHGAPHAVPVRPSLADGLGVARMGDLTYALAAPYVDDCVTVTEDELSAALSLLARTTGIVAEGAGAAPLAAVLAGKVSGRSLVLPVAGRNIDPHVHSAAVVRGQDWVPAVAQAAA